MAKEKNSNGKVSEIDKIISTWEEKLSIAEVNKNKQEAESIRRVLDYWRKKKAK